LQAGELNLGAAAGAAETDVYRLDIEESNKIELLYHIVKFVDFQQLELKSVVHLVPQIRTSANDIIVCYLEIVEYLVHRIDKLNTHSVNTKQIFDSINATSGALICSGPMRKPL